MPCPRGFFVTTGKLEPLVHLDLDHGNLIDPMWHVENSLRSPPEWLCSYEGPGTLGDSHSAHRLTQLSCPASYSLYVPGLARGYSQLSQLKVSAASLASPYLFRCQWAPAPGMLYLPFRAVVRAADATTANSTLKCSSEQLYSRETHGDHQTGTRVPRSCLLPPELLPA